MWCKFCSWLFYAVGYNFSSKIFPLDLYWSFSSFTGCSYLQEVYNFLWSGCTICKVRLWTRRNTYGLQYWKISSIHCILQRKSAFIQIKNDTKNTYLHVKCIVPSTIILFTWMYVAIPKNTKFCNRWHIRQFSTITENNKMFNAQMDERLFGAAAVKQRMQIGWISVIGIVFAAPACDY